MRIEQPSIKVLFHYPITDDGEIIQPEGFLELVGRTCYKSEDKITETSAHKFITMLNERGHTAMLEHCVASAHIVCNRGLTHELVRHRIASYAQESTRYCNYSKDKHDNAIGVIIPPFTVTTGESEREWRQAMRDAENHYMRLLELGEPAQIARGVLPIDLKTEIWITTNLREWQHIFSLRCSNKAHPQIRQIFRSALPIFAKTVPSMFLELNSKFS
jgi:thymidylate synthase (FAD)